MILTSKVTSRIAPPSVTRLGYYTPAGLSRTVPVGPERAPGSQAYDRREEQQEPRQGRGGERSAGEVIGAGEDQVLEGPEDEGGHGEEEGEAGAPGGSPPTPPERQEPERDRGERRPRHQGGEAARQVLDQVEARSGDEKAEDREEASPTGRRSPNGLMPWRSPPTAGPRRAAGGRRGRPTACINMSKH